jgi:hypothetical protein
MRADAARLHTNPVQTNPHINKPHITGYTTRPSPNSGACMHIGSPLALQIKRSLAVKLHNKRLCAATGEAC